MLYESNKTFLNKADAVDFSGYTVIGRRDPFCSDTNAHVDTLQTSSGVLLFAANELDGLVVQVLCSKVAQRLWFLVHCNVGPVFLCVWYRSPCPGDISAISTLLTTCNYFVKMSLERL